MGTWLFFAVILAGLIYLVVIYNRLVSLRNRLKNAFAQIDVQLQRRHDLIPNLVTTAKAYLEHERETLTRVTEARNQAEGARREAAAEPDDGAAVGRLGRAESILSGSLSRLLAVSENYPDLKADQTMQALTEELTATENRIGFARQAFNDAVMRYNTYREQFPNNAVSGLFGPFKEASLLDIENPEARRAVNVSF
ncbi:LemA family protein [Alloalcanivorax gelatiniphagus]|uniref:LemA family protein n=1 Tax=Alloalcanivorax gelatiniphagus TaxID=1194167 RepID=A0ABY2XLI3_9GAMM|nr:LemA family protein [Alloalcanivorax gelatiniphagus]TMW12151.1 LemA family protein [Alloalcanivorax gelatiniphagus]|tara:strand:+ start:6025 stop:6612 length:588 start_codon:yes stop_codon:yes gene_type:complete